MTSRGLVSVAVVLAAILAIFLIQFGFDLGVITRATKWAVWLAVVFFVLPLAAVLSVR